MKTGNGKFFGETGARIWFGEFGNEEEGLTFDNIFGNMEDPKIDNMGDPKEADNFEYKIHMNILFAKVVDRHYYPLDGRPCYEDRIVYLIIPLN